MQKAIEKELEASNLQVIDVTVKKIIQLYETKNSRHAVMIVGQTGSGKSVTWKTLRNTLTRLSKEDKDPQYQIVRVKKFAYFCLSFVSWFLFLGLSYQSQESVPRRAVWGVQSV